MKEKILGLDVIVCIDIQVKRVVLKDSAIYVEICMQHLTQLSCEIKITHEDLSPPSGRSITAFYI